MRREDARGYRREVEIQVLGPLRVVVAGRAVEIRRPKERAVLSLLAAHPGETVSADALVEGLWGAAPPATAGKTLQTYVHRLRGVLPEGSIATDGSGYRLAVDPPQVDAVRFAADTTALLEDGDLSPQERADRLTTVLGSWRGVPFADAEDAVGLGGARSRLEDLRLQVQVASLDALVRSGRPREALAGLRGVLDRHPLREDVWATYTLALYRSGRQADALAALASVRRVLAEELGLEPGPELRRLQEQVLAQDPDLLHPADSPPPSPSPPPSATVHPGTGVVTDQVERGRSSFERRAWGEAFTTLTEADSTSQLTVGDLEKLAISAYLVGRLEDAVAAWERAHEGCSRAGDVVHAARQAFWLAFALLNHGELGLGSGWVHRARRALDRAAVDCVERGYLEYCTALGQALGGDLARAMSGFASAARIGEQFDSSELVALARVGEGRSIIAGGDVSTGMALLDEAMALVTSQQVSPTAVGDVYCTVIEGCQEAFDVRRAQEWTESLSLWCESQPDLVLYRGQCLVHRAELMVLGGQWPQALIEVQRACEQLSSPRSHPALGAAHYVRAELHRLQGRYAEAEAAYRQASAWGRDPQPGRALLRLAQGPAAEARATIHRCLEEAGGDPLRRSRLLGPCVEISLATGDVANARAAAEELTDFAAEWRSPYLEALAAQASGAVLLAEEVPQEALVPLRRAHERWLELGAPHGAARTRELIGLACRAMGDAECAELELGAARAQLDELGADPTPGSWANDTAQSGGLTARELEVLRQVARGKSNRAVASALFISEKTVATHVSSILRKLDVPSRAAATAYAHQHHLV